MISDQCDEDVFLRSAVAQTYRSSCNPEVAGSIVPRPYVEVSLGKTRILKLLLVVELWRAPVKLLCVRSYKTTLCRFFNCESLLWSPILCRRFIPVIVCWKNKQLQCVYRQ